MPKLFAKWCWKKKKKIHTDMAISRAPKSNASFGPITYVCEIDSVSGVIFAYRNWDTKLAKNNYFPQNMKKIGSRTSVIRNFDMYLNSVLPFGALRTAASIFLNLNSICIQAFGNPGCVY